MDGRRAAPIPLQEVAMRLGLQFPNYTLPHGPASIGPTLGRTAQLAEQAGFYSFWVMDHFFQIEFIGPAEMDMLEGYSALTFVAGQTRRIKLGTMVTGVTYREPGILVKTATTLDVLSGGRAYFGLGAGWFEREHRGLGVRFPPVAERFERLEETLRIALQMWSGHTGPFHGKHYQLAETLCRPLPLSRPHPPILLGGMGEKKTLRMVAQHAQGCNLFAFAGVDEVRRKLEVLEHHCRALGRDYSRIEKTVLDSVKISREGGKGVLTPAEFLEQLHRWAEIGIDQYIFSLREVPTPQVFELLATEVVPQASKLRPTAHAL
jgi:F420-dependent oxidoreductase-like protein